MSDNDPSILPDSNSTTERGTERRVTITERRTERRVSITEPGTEPGVSITERGTERRTSNSSSIRERGAERKKSRFASWYARRAARRKDTNSSSADGDASAASNPPSADTQQRQPSRLGSWYKKHATANQRRLERLTSWGRATKAEQRSLRRGRRTPKKVAFNVPDNTESSESSGDETAQQSRGGRLKSWFPGENPARHLGRLTSWYRKSATQANTAACHFEREHRGWTFMIGCLCAGHAAPQDVDSAGAVGSLATREKEAKLRHLALLSSEYVRASPGPHKWMVGLRKIRRETEAEDEAAFEQHAPVPTAWPAQHFALDLGIEPPIGVGGPPPVVDAARAAAYFVKFAQAAYALNLYGRMHPLRTVVAAAQGAMSRQIAFQRMSGIAAEDILSSEPRAKPFKPAWWVFVDHASRTVVVTIRSTSALSDFLADAFARQVHHNGHVLHEGMLESAKWIHTRLIRRLAKCDPLQKHDYKLIVTGHGLGGAVAAILTWMLRDESDGPTYPALCFAYGAPLVVGWPLARKMQRFVIGIVHHNDVVPHIGRKSLEDLRDRVKEVTDSMEEDKGDSSLPALPMFNPGWQLHLRRRGINHRSAELRPVLGKNALRNMLLTAKSPDPSYMGTVRPSFTMWADHKPQAYYNVCEAFAERLELKTEPQGPSSLHEPLTRLTAYLESSDE